MKGYDSEGKLGPKKPLPDSIQIFEPSADKLVSEPTSEQREPLPVPVAPPTEEAYVAPDSSFQQPEGFTEQPVF